MKRRDLLKGLILAPVADLAPVLEAEAAAGSPAGSPEPPPAGGSGPGTRSQIAGMSLETLREQYRRDLFDDYLPFWERTGFDFELGGFMCAVDHDGTQVNTDKHMWYQGRGMWTHAFAYNHFGGEIHLEMARKTRDFILRHGMDKEGNWVRTLDREGGQIGGADRMGYTALFIAEGLQEYAGAAGDQESMELAIESFWKGARLYDDPARDVGQGYLPVSYPGMRIQGFEMVTIVLLTQLLQKRADPRLEARLDHAVKVVMERFWNPEYRLNNEA